MIRSRWIILGVCLLAGLMLGGMVTPFVMVVDLFPADLIGTASGW